MFNSLDSDNRDVIEGTYSLVQALGDKVLPSRDCLICRNKEVSLLITKDRYFRVTIEK